MKHYSASEIDLFISRFESKTLPKPEWTHEAHLVVAIWYLSKYPFEKAAELVRTNIWNHNASVGTPNSDSEGYHETITLFWLRIAHLFMEDHSEHTLAEMCNAFIDSDLGKSAYPFEFYSCNLLFSTEARKAWIDPNIKHLPPFPF